MKTLRIVLSHFQLIAFILLTSSSVMAQKSLDLSYNLKSGQEYSLTINTNQTIQMEMMGQTMLIKQNIDNYQDVVVKEVNADGHITLEYTYKRIKLHQDAMGMDITFDSDNMEEADNPMVQQVAASMNSVIGKTILTTIDRYGNPLSNNISDVMPENSSVQGAESGMMTIFAGHPVQVGDSWEVETAVDMNSDMLIKSTYKLDEIKGKSARISFNGLVTGSEIGGNTAKVDGEITGMIELDIATGWTRSATIRQSMTMLMQEEGMSMPMTMSSVTELTSK
jgi:hypothetical protein